MKIILNARKTMEGNIIIRDHHDVDIVIAPLSKKIILLPKKKMVEDLYPIQKRFFQHLRENGATMLGSESTGFIYNSYEALYVESSAYDSIAVLLRFIHEFVTEERTVYDKLKQYKNDLENELLAPTDEKSTEYGKIPHKELDGSQLKDPYHSYVSSWFGWR